MIEVHEIKNSIELMEEFDFVSEAIAMVCYEKHKDEYIKLLFDTIRKTVGDNHVGVWIQTQGQRRLVFATANILTELSGEKVCWVRLVYSKPGGDLRMVIEDKIIPWAKERGATKLQASNEDFEKSIEKDRWFHIYGLKKVMEVYERRIGIWDKSY